MFLTRLIYTSSVSEKFSSDDIPAILDAARNNNQKANVTGMLCFNSKYFLQCLEGSREEVNKIYNSILNDERHKLITLLCYGEVSVREFGKWSMGYIPESSLTAPTNIKYSATPEFDPYEMSGESALKMMLAMKERVPSV